MFERLQGWFAVGRADRRGHAGQPAGSFAASQGSQGGRSRDGSCRRNASRLQHRPERSCGASGAISTSSGKSRWRHSRPRSTDNEIQPKKGTRHEQMITIAPVRKSVRVNAPPARAFDVFTAKMSAWWPATPHDPQIAVQGSNGRAARRRTLVSRGRGWLDLRNRTACVCGNRRASRGAGVAAECRSGNTTRISIPKWSLNFMPGRRRHEGRARTPLHRAHGQGGRRRRAPRSTRPAAGVACSKRIPQCR